VDIAQYILMILWGTLRLAEVVLIFSILVIGHEYGHFLIARACGMRVDEFAIGFGKRLFSWKRGETTWSINLVPIGGYNKIYGMDLEDEEEANAKGKDEKSKAPKAAPQDYSIAPRDDPRAFVNRPLYQRFFVALAGSVANIVIAVLVVFLMGITIGFPAAELGGVIPGGPADTAGLMSGDIITRLNGVRLSSTADLHNAIRFSNGSALRVSGMRGTESFNATVIPQSIRLVDTHFCRLGFVYLNDGTVIYTRPDSPAERADLQPGDIILYVDGIPFPSHRLEIEEGNGVLGLRVYRGYHRISVDIEYFDNEIIRDNYSTFGFFFNDQMVITAVIEGGIADEGGLEPGDEIVEASTQTWEGTGLPEVPAGQYMSEGDEVLEGPVEPGQIAPYPGPEPVRATTFKYRRNGDIYHTRLDPDPGFSRIEVYMDDASLPILTGLPVNHRLAQAGMKSGDEILSIEGAPTPNGITAFLEFEKHIGESVTVVALSNGEERVFTIPIPPEENSEELQAFFGGLRFKTRYFSSDPVGSFIAGTDKSVEITRLIFMTIGMLISGQANLNDLAGPVGIAAITYQAASNGLVDLINIMVLLSVNLAIFNLLPFPALDGGRILFMAFEAILRRPVVNVRVENLIHIAGFLLLLLLALVVAYNDIARLIFSN
jgi:membrane-associated protease RseP (regulator of RpoE activity)